MIRKWDIKKYGVDFMGYKKASNDMYTFHHLIIPSRKDGPMVDWNGVILCGKTSHPYLHLIESTDYDRFIYLTGLLIDENLIGRLDLRTIKEIDLVLKMYEKEYQGKTNAKKKRLIKPEYTIRDYSSLKF